ncbi:integrator complex subunit 5 [Athene noctua]|uniref:integrator complex subunit 5 n=1 Tax=Athene noctua TaxID=126797 RepID=UPI003EBA2E5C
MRRGAAAAAAAMSGLCDPPGAASPPRPPLSAQDLAQEVKAFLSGVDPVVGTKLSPSEHARCALLLLRSLPPARHAALEHLRGVFDDQVCSHLLERENGGPHPGAGPPAGGAPGLAEVVQEVQRVLGDFVRLNPQAWAPVVSAWSIDLMGQLSSKYAGRHGVPPPAGLNELLQLWMSCGATRTLMEIYTQCLAAMIGACPDACVDALLDTSVQHSPHFDWVVAHIGSSFPGTIINRVLSCGLKDFCAHGAAAPGDLLFGGAAGGGGDKRVPKIASVVGILGHLASRHSGSIKQELLRLFHESLTPARDQHQKAAVPFLLQLAVMSPPLLGAISSELVDSLKPNVLNQLHQHFSSLPREDLDNMVGIVVHLICQTSAGAYRILQFLVNTAMPASVITPPGPGLHDGVREACDRVIQLLLLHLQKLVYNRGNPGGPAEPSPSSPRPVPFLDALRPHVRDLCVETLRLERKRFLWQHQLLSLLAVYSAPHSATDALFFLLTLARSQEELALATQLYAVLSSCLPDLLPATVKACVCQIHAGRLPEPQIAQLFRNLALVVQWEGGEAGPAAMGAQLGAILSRHLPDLAQLLLHRSPDVAEAASFLLAVCPLPRAVPPAHLLAAVRAAVHQFFAVLRRENAAGVWYSGRVLARLSAVSPAAAKAVLQHLVEAALRGGNAELFGAVPEKPAEEASRFEETGDVSLLDVNRRFTAAVNFSGGGVWSVFHAGVIGRGLKTPTGHRETAPEAATRNAQTFLSLLLRCCHGGRPTDHPALTPPGAGVNPEAAKAVAAALVEAVCPEAAGGDLVWPPEDQARGTVERDLRICRRFRQNPLLFPLLRVVAAGRPALCYCSVLLRGLLASLMAHWDASREPRTAASPWHLAASCSLVACMAEGSLLPPVLGNMHEIFHHLAPFEVHLLLLSVWDYLRENSPLPQKFTFHAQRGVFLRDFARDGDVGKHLAVLHSVLHKNIHRLGLLAGRFRP